MPFEIHNEIAISTGLLSDWVCSPNIRTAIVLDEEANAGAVNRVLTEGYGENLTDSDLEKIGQDPFLIAYALAAADRTVVTKETPRPGAMRANRKIPDICDTLNIQWMRDFDLYRTLHFTTASRWTTWALSSLDISHGSIMHQVLIVGCGANAPPLSAELLI